MCAFGAQTIMYNGVIMIYSDNINKICALCKMSCKSGEEDVLFCRLKNKAVSANKEACKKFSYDILKRHVRRIKKLKTDFNPEDFTL